MRKAREKSNGWIGQALIVGMVLALAAGLGWLVAGVGFVTTLRVAGALILPVLLLAGIVRANQKQKGSWVTVVLMLVLYALAAAGVWGLMGRLG